MVDGLGRLARSVAAERDRRERARPSSRPATAATAAMPEPQRQRDAQAGDYTDPSPERRLDLPHRLQAGAPPTASAADLELWTLAVSGVAPLRPGDAPTPPSAPPARPTNAASVVAPAAPRKATAPRLPPATARLHATHPVDLDRRTWLKLRRGRYPLDARLDLHGLTQAQAHERLAQFVTAARGRGDRCLLVITGRGLQRGGALRLMTPRWLDAPPLRHHVLAFAEATLEHGGEGALYVLLRRGG